MPKFFRTSDANRKIANELSTAKAIKVATRSCLKMNKTTDKKVANNGRLAAQGDIFSPYNIFVAPVKYSTASEVGSTPPIVNPSVSNPWNRQYNGERTRSNIIANPANSLHLSCMRKIKPKPNSTTRLHSTTRFRLVLRDFAFAAVRAWPV